MTGDLADAFFRKTGKAVDKWEQYLPVYAREFARFRARGAPVALLEVGVQNGGSLELWAQVLPAGSTVTGLDIDPKVGGLAFDTDRIRTFVADASRAEAVDAVLGGQSFDIVIDDGSHKSSDVVATFPILFPRVRPGGLYVIEDLHCSYYASHGGGFRRPDASIAWLKGLIDALNADHVAPHEVEPEELRRLMRANREVAGIGFYDSLAVIEKLALEKNRPYRRLLSGEHSEVVPLRDVAAAAPRGTLDAMLFGHAAARALDAELLGLLDAARARTAGLEGALAQAGQAARAADERAARHAAEHADRQRMQAETAAAQADALAAAAAREADLRAALSAEEAAHRVASEQVERLAAARAQETGAAEDRDKILAALARMQAETAAGLDGGLRQVVSEVRLAERRAAPRIERVEARIERLGGTVEAARRALAADLARSSPLSWLPGGRQPERQAGRALPEAAAPTAADAPVRSRGLRRPVPRFERGRARLVARLFSPSWYRQRYPDVVETGADPLTHYLRFGAAEARDPHPLFDGAWYRARAPDLARSGLNPVVHYLTVGAAEGLDPHPLFDGRWYLWRYPDVRAAGVNPLRHYIEHGLADLRDPHPLFDAGWYRARHPELGEAGVTPLEHFVAAGPWSGFDPHPLFASSWYAGRHPDAAATGVTPFQHYLDHGAAEGRDPHPLFDAAWYLAGNPGVAVDGGNPLRHYVECGDAEGRAPHPLFDAAWYAAANPDVRASGRNTLAHYLIEGAAGTSDPNRLFSGRWYRAENPDVAEAGLNPLMHFVQDGAAEDRDPHPLFDLSAHPQPAGTAAAWERLAHHLHGTLPADAEAIRAEGVFADDWYARQAPAGPDVGDPVLHYLTVGAALGLSPHPLFDAAWYRARHPDIGAQEPLLHYARVGAEEGRRPGPLVEPGWFLGRRGHPGDADLNPLAFHSRHGSGAARTATPLFDPDWYAAQNPAVAASGADPLSHYAAIGMAAGLAPNPLFEPAWYRTRHAALMPPGFGAFRHFTALGSRQDLDPGPSFETGWYRTAYPAAAATGLEPLAHFLAHGRAEGRRPHTDNADTRVAVIAHVYYPELIAQIKSHLRSIESPFDLYVTLPETAHESVRSRLRRLHPDTVLIPVPDRGFDIAPFFAALERVRARGRTYDAVCKIHTKKGRTEPATWRHLLLNAVLGGRPLVGRIIRSFSKDPTLALVGARDFYLDGEKFSRDNRAAVERLYGDLYPHGPRPRRWGFFAGTMFWFRPGLFDRLGELLGDRYDFEASAANDGLIAHGVERMFGLIAAAESARVGLVEFTPDGGARWDNHVQDAGRWTNEEPPHRFLARTAEALRSRLPSEPDGTWQVLRRWRPEAARSPGVRLVAPVQALNGIGASARGYLRCLRASGARTRAFNWTRGFERVRQIAVDGPPDGDEPIQITHLNLDLLLAISVADPAAFDDLVQGSRYNIVIPYFELVSLKPEWLPVLTRFDEVWCASTFLERAIDAASTVRTRVVRPTILPEIARAGAYGRAHFGLPEDRFAFGYFADAGSILDRKNPLALVEAYVAEFKASDGACCFVKVHYGRHDHPTIARILAIAGTRPDVVFSEALYADDEMEALIGLLDAYVSPHRSEGLGLTIVEAMNAGTPVIATNYGGAIDLLDPEASLPVPYRLAEVGAGNAPYPANYTWADPDPDALRAAMRALFDDRDRARRIGAAGRTRVAALFGPDATTVAARAALDDIWQAATAAAEAGGPA